MPSTPTCALLVMPAKPMPLRRARWITSSIAQRAGFVGQAVAVVDQAHRAAVGDHLRVRGAVGAAVPEESAVERHARHAVRGQAMLLGAHQVLRGHLGHHRVRAGLFERISREAQQFAGFFLHNIHSKGGTPMGKFIELKAADGHKLAAYVAAAVGQAARRRGRDPGDLRRQQPHPQVADGYAADGYLAVAPAMFDRAQRDYDTGYTQPEIEAGVEIMQKLDWTQAMLDVEAAIGERDARRGKVGIVGYCWGGTVTWVAAARATGLACAVPYYGGGMPGFIDEKPQGAR